MKKLTKYILILISVTILIGVAIGLYLYNKPQESITRSKPEFILTAIDLNKDFIRNDSIAGEKYTGHIVQVTGSIADIMADSAHGITLTLDDPMAGVRCSMDKILVPITEVSKLLNGSNVEIKGVCTGYDELFGVALNRCIFVK